MGPIPEAQPYIPPLIDHYFHELPATVAGLLHCLSEPVRRGSKKGAVFWSILPATWPLAPQHEQGRHSYRVVIPAQHGKAAAP